MLSGKDAGSVSRKPEIVADAAYAIICRDSRAYTGNFAVDEDILKEEGITDMNQYAVDPCKPLKYFWQFEHLGKSKRHRKVIKHEKWTICLVSWTLLLSASKEALMLDFFLETGPHTMKIAQQSSGSAAGDQIASIFEKIQANLSSELVSKTNAVFHFAVKGW